MDIEEIQKYIEDNNITFDFENDNYSRLIDYTDTLSPISSISKEKMQKFVDQISKVVKESGVKVITIDSLSSP